MIRNVDIQNEYVDLYTLFRNYIWDYSTVCKLADLEVRCHETCPDIPKIQESLWKLKSDIINTLHDDEEMLAVFDEFEDLLESSNNEYYVDLPSVQEVIQEDEFEDGLIDEDFDEDAEDLEDENFEESEQ